MSVHSLIETCGCGSSIRVTEDYAVNVEKRQEAFHKQHRACRPIEAGPCEERSFQGLSCRLRAGHAGFHETETDMATGARSKWGFPRWTACDGRPCATCRAASEGADT